MTITNRTLELKNAVNQTRVVTVFQEKGDTSHQWKISTPEGAAVLRSTSLPSGGYYATPADAVRSARRILSTLAQ